MAGNRAFSGGERAARRFLPCPRDKQRDAPAALCGLCGGEVYREDTLYAWEGGYLCQACMEDKFSAMTVREKAELLGAYPVRANAADDLPRVRGK